MENTTNSKCPKCGGEMEEGAELYPGVGGYQVKYWTRDLVQNKRVGGFTVAGSVYEHKDGLITKAHRCVNCGFLESFAK